MNGMEDESVDLIVTDSPYLMKYKTCRRKNKDHKFCHEILNDDCEEVIEQYIKQCYRILKNNCAMYMFCNSNKIDVFKHLIERHGFKIKNIIIWVKNNHTAGDLQAQFGKAYEMIILANKGRKKINGKRLEDVWYFDRVSGNNLVHQNQKPLDLICRCIKCHSDENDVVFDGFAGSATTGVACVELNRKFIGCELDGKYYKIAKERIRKAVEENG